jgi:cell division protein FtsN
MRQQICKQQGSTGVGLMIGLILGLLVAVLVAIFVTKAPVPWVTKVGKAHDTKAHDNKPVELKAGSEVPDPNKSLYGKNSKAGETPVVGAAPTEPSPAENKDSILGLLGSLGKENLPASKEPDKPAAKVVESKPAEPKVADAKPAEAKPEKAVEADSTRYLLQAGAFRDRDDADGMKGKLALLGYEARVTTIEREGNTIYRVRTGPFKQLDEANAVRKRLADGGVETSLVPLRQ